MSAAPNSRSVDPVVRQQVAERLGASVGDRLVDVERRRGRGAVSNVSGRFETERREAFDDGWERDETAAPFKTEIVHERPKAILTRNQSPDLPFDRSINPYRGCEHGCAYCYARPTHSYLGLSPGLDFETKLTVKDGAAELLEQELSRKNYAARVVALGANTDAYQPIERKFRVTRSVLEVLERTNHPVSIVTKSNLILRDLDLLQALARKQLVKVFISVTSLERDLARRLEPRAPTPERRLEAIQKLAEAGVPVGVMLAPVIPSVNDAEVEAILGRASGLGAKEAGYVTLRLPLELRDMFREWLATNFPDKLERTLALVQSLHGGKDYSAKWGHRMAGSGPYAWMISRRFEIAHRRFGFRETPLELRNDLFVAPLRKNGNDGQLSLF